MASETVRIKPETHAKLRTIAEETGQPMPEILDQAIEGLRRKRMLEATDRAYAALREDPKAWGAEQAELEVWNLTLPDGQESN